MSRLTIDRRCWVAAPLTDMKHQEEHELFSCVQHEDEPRQDLRSASVEYKRDADQGHKYYYFKVVKRGDVGQAYYTAPNATSRFVRIGLEELPADRSEARIEVWTKRTLFVQAQGYPRPPQHHHHCRGCQEGKDAWLKRQIRTRDIRQILKVSPADLYEEDRLIGLDVMSDSVRDDWYDPSEAHDQLYAKVVEERNNEAVGEIRGRAVTKWKNHRRCESSRAALSVAPPELS
ncbi:MAG: hypothetical protein LQ347_004640 [Umbilicaria vellea]|nr:MAG: hypothetical protein LQ347_004640 [Umbilicaria vellea]